MKEQLPIKSFPRQFPTIVEFETNKKSIQNQNINKDARTNNKQIKGILFSPYFLNRNVTAFLNFYEKSRMENISNIYIGRANRYVHKNLEILFSAYFQFIKS